MIAGVGVDLCEIDRFESLLQNSRFMARVFTARERTYIGEGARCAEKAAGMFCAKEAFSKAVGTGLSGLCLAEVEVDHDVRGAPVLRLYGQAGARYAHLRFALSISHTRDTAAAFVTAYRPWEDRAIQDMPPQDGGKGDI